MGDQFRMSLEHYVNLEANTKRIRAVEEAFGASGGIAFGASGGIFLMEPGRMLVGEGEMLVLQQDKAEFTPVQVFLFNDIILYGHRHKLRRKKLSQPHVYPLDGASVHILSHPAYRPLYAWQVNCRKRDVLTLYTDSQVEQRLWVGHIQRCLDAMTGTAVSEAVYCQYCRESHVLGASVMKSKQ